MNHKKTTLYLALLVAFIDFFGVGLIYPIFPAMLFDTSYPLLAPDTSEIVRGIWLGILIAIMPLAQFFSAPLWGALSDNQGRKKPLLQSLAITIIGYLIAVFASALDSLLFLLVSRIVIGFASGNTSIVQAAVSDLSTATSKTKNFALYGMALGLGFMLGPFCGGILSAYGYTVPFIVALVIIALNYFFAIFYFEETHFQRTVQKIKFSMALTQLKKAFLSQSIRTILLVSFLYNFGWTYFFEFAPVYLIHKYQFSAVELGIFYGVAGGFYALSTGILIRPFLDRSRPEKLVFWGIFVTALSIFLLPFLPSIIWLWPVIFIMTYFISFVPPTTTAIISNGASTELQGEALGNLNSVNAAAFMLSPLFSGSLVGAFPSLPIWLGGLLMVGAALLMLNYKQSAVVEKA